MIRYALTCEAGHAFESWFRDSGAFEAQVKAGQVVCPHCGSAEVSKQIMAPAVAVHEAPSDAELRTLVRALHTRVKESSEDVGEDFAAEARKIHYGEADERAIHGQASLGEAKELLDEGIAVLPLPPLPEEKN